LFEIPNFGEFDMSTSLFTSESVSCGHPDKIADQISDAVLDACLAQDPHSRVACETMVSPNLVVIAGEVTTKADVNYEAVARETIRDIGYDDEALGFDAASVEVKVVIHEQSSDIAQGVDEGTGVFKEQGAGDQGMMFGYACDETPELMPVPITAAHGLMHEVTRLRREGVHPYLRPDAKSQVTVEYGESGKALRIDAIVLSVQHSEDVEHGTLARDMEAMARRIIPNRMLDDRTRFYVNPTGRFVIGGPVGDCGLTGRKIIVDTYGGMGRHGGGCFSGKDPSKVDRSGAYAGRYIAKNVVAAGLAKRCEVQVAYAIGVPYPVSIKVDTFGTGTVSEEKLCAAIPEIFDLSPRGIIEMLDLLRPIYLPTAAGGHFGRPTHPFPWEATNKVDPLLQKLGLPPLESGKPQALSFCAVS
jgi:S-adenosylmethionine synthetase